MLKVNPPPPKRGDGVNLFNVLMEGLTVPSLILAKTCRHDEISIPSKKQIKSYLKNIYIYIYIYGTCEM